MTNSFTKTAIYWLLFGGHLLTLYWDCVYLVPNRKPVTKDGLFKGLPARLCFFTFWNLIFQTVYFGFVCLAQLGKNSNQNYQPSYIRCYFARGIAGPAAFFVGVTFWAIYSINRELVYPAQLDTFISQWWNHGAHTLPLIGAIIDRYLSDFTYQQRNRPWRPFRLTFLIGVCYLSTVLYVGLVKEAWVYGILEVLDTKGRALFFAGLMAFLLVSFLIMDFISKLFWPATTDKQRKN